MCFSFVESKEYLDKYSKSLHVSTTMVENKENDTSLDFSSFSIGTELVDINSSNSLLKETFQRDMFELEGEITGNCTSSTLRITLEMNDLLRYFSLVFNSPEKKVILFFTVIYGTELLKHNQLVLTKLCK